MSFGEMNGFAELIATKNGKDSEGFSTTVEKPSLLSVCIGKVGMAVRDGQISPHFLRQPTYSVSAAFPDLRSRRIKSSFQTETALRSSPWKM